MNQAARDANEAEFRRALLEKLDRIITLLTPTVTTYPVAAPTVPPLGYSCAVCGMWVPYGTSHICAGRRSATGSPG